MIAYRQATTPPDSPFVGGEYTGHGRLNGKPSDRDKIVDKVMCRQLDLRHSLSPAKMSVES